VSDWALWPAIVAAGATIPPTGSVAERLAEIQYGTWLMADAIVEQLTPAIEEAAAAMREFAAAYAEAFA
jgi:ABC-type thiamin/hydroxymethylpyrimidine transport system permease subunit